MTGQSQEEKYQRRALRKKIARWKERGLDTTELEKQFNYRTSPEFRAATSHGGQAYWEQNPQDPRKELFQGENFKKSSASYAASGWANPEFIAKRGKALLDFYSIPQNRLEHSLTMQLALDTPEFRAKCSQRTGPNATNWRGGISFEPYCYKFNDDFKRNVRHFFENKCVLCLYEGLETPRQSRLLNVHHVHYDKESLCNEDSPRMFATLCDSHHGVTNGDREFWGALLEEIITAVYNGQSYYCEEEWTKIKAYLGSVELLESTEVPVEA